jgi:hypothetical protein
MATPNSGKDLGVAELRQKITELVAHNAIAMVQCAIDGVMEQGQYQAIKYLFEMVGIYPAPAGGSDEPEDTLSKLLLRHLGVAEFDEAAPEEKGTTKGTESRESIP